jgi:hypothetical protein
MSAPKVILIGALALAGVMFAGVADHTHAESAKRAAQSRALRDYKRNVSAVFAERGRTISRLCGDIEPYKALTPQQSRCGVSVMDRLPVPSKPNLPVVGVSAEHGWATRRAWYVFAALAVVILACALAFSVRDRPRQEPLPT